MSTTTPFFEANLWGMAGTITGVIGLIISWINWRYSRPKIEIAELKLKSKPNSKIKENYANKSFEQLVKISFRYTLDIRLRNKKGGSGSIEKPLLIIETPSKRKERTLLHRIILKPHTKNFETKNVALNTFATTTIPLGEAWNFSGGQTVDDELEYEINNQNMIFHIVQNYEKLIYYIEYHDNFGKKYRKNITQFKDK